jgi:hypothetical protein
MSATSTEQAPQQAKQETSGAGEFEGRWLSDHAELCAVLCLMVGFVFVVTSSFLRIDWVSFNGELKPPLDGIAVGLAGVTKEVGYVPALNWSLFGVIFLPLIVLMGLLVLRNIEATLDALASRGMLRKRDTVAPLTSPEIIAYWRKGDLTWRILLIAVFVLGSGFIVLDAWVAVIEPQLRPDKLSQTSISDGLVEFDWSVSCLFEGRPDCSDTLRIFVMAAYVMVPGFATVFAFCVAVMAMRFMAFVAGSGGRRKEWLIVADLDRSKERHSTLMGWQVFEPFFSCLLYWAIAVLAGLWLMVVQNAYLRDATSTNIGNFLIEDSGEILANLNIDTFSKRVAQDGITKVVGDGWSWLVGDSTMQFAGNMQATAGITVFGFVCALTVFGSWLLLRSTARRSRDVTLEHLAVISTSQELDRKQVKQWLRKMRFWPVGWIGQAPLFGLVLLMLGSLFSYRLIMVPIAILAGTALASVGYALVDKVRRRMEKNEDDEA